MNIGQEKEFGTPFSSNWEKTVVECHQRPLGVRIQSIQHILDELNSKTFQTNMAFHLQPVVDGVITPNVSPYYHNGVKWTKPIKLYEQTGPEVQALLDKLPQFVRSGTNKIFEVYQISLDNFCSYEHLMGMTKLLLFFLMCRDEGDLCYFFANDHDSYTNWDVLKKMYSKHFPQLEEGKKLS